MEPCISNCIIPIYARVLFENEIRKNTTIKFFMDEILVEEIFLDYLKLSEFWNIIPSNTKNLTLDFKTLNSIHRLSREDIISLYSKTNFTFKCNNPNKSRIELYIFWLNVIDNTRECKKYKL